MEKGYNMTDFEVVRKALINAGYDIEINDYGEYGSSIDVKRVGISFEFKNGNLEYIYNERHEDY